MLMTAPTTTPSSAYASFGTLSQSIFSSLRLRKIYQQHFSFANLTFGWRMLDNLAAGRACHEEERGRHAARDETYDRAGPAEIKPLLTKGACNIFTTGLAARALHCSLCVVYVQRSE